MLIRLALHDENRRWVEETCVRLARNPSPIVRSAVAQCIGHLARLHGEIDAELVLPVLRDLSNDPETAGDVSDACDDIEKFVAPVAVG